MLSTFVKYLKTSRVIKCMRASLGKFHILSYLSNKILVAFPVSATRYRLYQHYFKSQRVILCLFCLVKLSNDVSLIGSFSFRLGDYHPICTSISLLIRKGRTYSVFCFLFQRNARVVQHFCSIIMSTFS